MFLSKLELGLEHLYCFEQARAQAQAFFVLSSKLELDLKTIFCARNPLQRGAPQMGKVGPRKWAKKGPAQN